MTYLFKDENGFIFGDTNESECPAGKYRIDPSQDRSTVTIRYASDDKIKIPEAKIASFVNKAGVPYANYAALKSATNGFFDAPEDNGVCNGCVAATLSDTVDLPNPGFIQPRTAGGNINVTDVNGNESTLAFDQKETSLFRVKRVWSTGTTATGIVIYY